MYTRAGHVPHTRTRSVHRPLPRRAVATGRRRRRRLLPRRIVLARVRLSRYRCRRLRLLPLRLLRLLRRRLLRLLLPAHLGHVLVEGAEQGRHVALPRQRRLQRAGVGSLLLLGGAAGGSGGCGACVGSVGGRGRVRMLDNLIRGRKRQSTHTIIIVLEQNHPMPATLPCACPLASSAALRLAPAASLFLGGMAPCVGLCRQRFDPTLPPAAQTAVPKPSSVQSPRLLRPAVVGAPNARLVRDDVSVFMAAPRSFLSPRWAAHVRASDQQVPTLSSCSSSVRGGQAPG